MRHFGQRYFRARHFTAIVLLILLIPPVNQPEYSAGDFVREDLRPKNRKLAEQIRREDEEILIIIKVLSLCR